jgi:TetR/AcrR family transcriptional regulator
VETSSQTGRATADGEATRLRILDAAEAVFAERGYTGASTREIAVAAGIGKRMLFYYFPTKDALYRAVLERVIVGMAAIHERFRNEPGPLGLADAVGGVVQFAAANLRPLKLLMREIMDEGVHLPELSHDYLRPLFEQGAAEVARNMEEGVFRRGDPMHVVAGVGGLTLFYFLLVPLLRLVWNRDPLAADALAEQAAWAQLMLTQGLAPGNEKR